MPRATAWAPGGAPPAPLARPGAGEGAAPNDEGSALIDEGFVGWPPELAQRYRESGLWQGRTLYDMLACSAGRWPQHTALVDGDRRLGCAQLLAQVDTYAAGLRALGLRRGERVVFQLANGIELVAAFFALMRLGVVPVLALPAHRRSEIAHFVQASQASALFVSDLVRDFDHRTMAREVAAQCPTLRHVLVDGQALEGQIALRELGLQAAPDGLPPIASSAVALMLLSGGTTGLPKLIARTHDDYLCGCLHSAQVAGLGPDAVMLALLPMAHNYTLGAPGFVGALACGATTVIARSTRAEAVLPLIERERVTLACAAAPLIARWLASDLIAAHDVSSLRTLMCGGSRLAPELRRRVERSFGCEYQESYGTAEGLLNMTRLGDAEPLRLHSSGRPVCEADEVRIVDEHGREVPDGVAGELQTRGPYTIRGYWRAPQADAAAFTADGFYRMGDRVSRVDGYLYVHGRLREQINRGGEKISCEEIENEILAHPDVASVSVVGLPDAEFGERACAVAVLRAGARLDLEALRQFLKGREIARFKWPERLEIVDELPLSPAGKVLRRELQRRFAPPSKEA